MAIAGSVWLFYLLGTLVGFAIVEFIFKYRTDPELQFEIDRKLFWLPRRIREHFHRFKRACSWFVFMYNNHSWCDSYLYKMIDKKLAEMEHTQTYYSHALCHYSLARLIKLTRKYYDLSVNFSFEKAWKKFEERYGETEILTKELPDGYSEWLGIGHKKCKTKEENEYASKLSHRLFRMEEYQQEKYRKKFLNMLITHGRYWWD